MALDRLFALLRRLSILPSRLHCHRKTHYARRSKPEHYCRREGGDCSNYDLWCHMVSSSVRLRLMLGDMLTI